MEKLFPHNADETVAVRVAAEVDECHATGKPPDTGYAPTNFEMPAGVRKEPFVVGCLDDCGDRVVHPELAIPQAPRFFPLASRSTILRWAENSLVLLPSG